MARKIRKLRTMLKSYEVTIEGDRIKWLGEKPQMPTNHAILVIEQGTKSFLKRTTPAHLIGKGRTLGDIVNPIVEEEDWECLK